MFFKLKPFLYSLVYLAILEFLNFNRQQFFIVLFFLIIFSIFVVWPLARKIVFLASPLFLSFGSICLLFFISSFLESQIFIFSSSIVYYLSLLGSYRLKIYPCDKTAQGMINLASIATALFLFSAIFLWFLNYNINTTVLLILVFFAVFFINLSIFSSYVSGCIKIKERFKRRNEKCEIKFIKNKKVLWFLNAIIALIIAQVSWFLLFWPFNAITTGTILMIIYFGFWDIARNFIIFNLSCKRIVFDIILVCTTVALILTTAQWELII